MSSEALQAYNNKLRFLVERAKDKALERIIVPPANKLLATIKNRVQRKGENTSGGKIGNYSTKPMYASRDQFDKKSSFKPVTKKYISTDAKAPKTVKGRNVLGTIYSEKGKTMYLQQGYKELRDVQGKPTDKVNLTYRGDLMNSYQQVVEQNAVVQGLTLESEKKKREGLEKRFGGQLLHPQKQEIETYRKDVTEIAKTESVKIMKGAYR